MADLAPDQQVEAVLPKLIAFYLPQFHPIPENDAWWGAGFTEWRNVARATPMFDGHHQPQIPADLGFYDLRVPETRALQVDLARRYGISGFCYYYYWFNGRRLLERPLQDVLASGEPDFPFCICWANESWSRRWDGSEQSILIAQEHTPESDARFIEDALPILTDPRYITVKGKPLLLVYRAELLADPQATAAVWRRRSVEAGLPGLHLCAVRSFETTDPRPLGFDASVEFPPQQAIGRNVHHQVSGLRPDFDGYLFDYRAIAEHFLARPAPGFPMYQGIMPSWDNTARRMLQGQIIHNGTPENYQAWLHELLLRSAFSRKEDDFIFINAWNEWAEGAHLEPDLRHGHAYLEATRAALDAARRDRGTAHLTTSQRFQPLVSVVIPSYNHARYIRRAIESVAEQTYANIELVIVDDGSTDGSPAIIEQVLREAKLPRVISKRHVNIGAASTIDRGISMSSGQYVAILNSDDWYDPRRIELLVQAVDQTGDAFAFTGLHFVADDAVTPIPYTADVEELDWYRRGLWLADLCPTAGFALLASSLTVSTSNFFFSRGLFEKLHGFHPNLRLAHDHDFVLRLLYYCEPRFIPTPLLSYRYHRSNSYRSLVDLRPIEGETALRRYVELFQEPPLNRRAPSIGNWPLFFSEFIERISPHFSNSPLAAHFEGLELPDAFFHGPEGEPRQTPDSQTAWIEHLRKRLTDPDCGDGTSIEALRERLARRWAAMTPSVSDPSHAVATRRRPSV